MFALLLSTAGLLAFHASTANAIPSENATVAAPVTVTPAPGEHRLRLFHTHTNERIDIVYKVGDTYIPSALARLNYFLRDHRTGDVRAYDPREFDLL